MDIQSLNKYVVYLASQLHLSDWELSVSIESPEPSSYSPLPMGEVVKVADRPCASIIFNPLFFEASASEQRHYVIHELLHLHIQRLWRHIEMTKEYIGLPAFGLYGEAARSDMEEVVDRLTYIIEPFLPLPGILLSDA